MKHHNNNHNYVSSFNYNHGGGTTSSNNNRKTTMSATNTNSISNTNTSNTTSLTITSLSFKQARALLFGLSTCSLVISFLLVLLMPNYYDLPSSHEDTVSKTMGGGGGSNNHDDHNHPLLFHSQQQHAQHQVHEQQNNKVLPYELPLELHEIMLKQQQEKELRNFDTFEALNKELEDEYEKRKLHINQEHQQQNQQQNQYQAKIKPHEPFITQQKHEEQVHPVVQQQQQIRSNAYYPNSQEEHIKEVMRMQQLEQERHHQIHDGPKITTNTNLVNHNHQEVEKKDDVNQNQMFKTTTRDTYNNNNPNNNNVDNTDYTNLNAYMTPLDMDFHHLHDEVHNQQQAQQQQAQNNNPYEDRRQQQVQGQVPLNNNIQQQQQQNPVTTTTAKATTTTTTTLMSATFDKLVKIFQGNASRVPLSSSSSFSSSNGNTNTDTTNNSPQTNSAFVLLADERSGGHWIMNVLNEHPSICSSSTERLVYTADGHEMILGGLPIDAFVNVVPEHNRNNPDMNPLQHDIHLLSTNERNHTVEGMIVDSCTYRFIVSNVQKLVRHMTTTTNTGEPIPRSCKEINSENPLYSYRILERLCHFITKLNGNYQIEHIQQIYIESFLNNLNHNNLYHPEAKKLALDYGCSCSYETKMKGILLQSNWDRTYLEHLFQPKTSTGTSASSSLLYGTRIIRLTRRDWFTRYVSVNAALLTGMVHFKNVHEKDEQMSHLMHLNHDEPIDLSIDHMFTHFEQYQNDTLYGTNVLAQQYGSDLLLIDYDDCRDYSVECIQKMIDFLRVDPALNPTHWTTTTTASSSSSSTTNSLRTSSMLFGEYNTGQKILDDYVRNKEIIAEALNANGYQECLRGPRNLAMLDEKETERNHHHNNKYTHYAPIQQIVYRQQQQQQQQSNPRRQLNNGGIVDDTRTRLPRVPAYPGIQNHYVVNQPTPEDTTKTTTATTKFGPLLYQLRSMLLVKKLPPDTLIVLNNNNNNNDDDHHQTIQLNPQVVRSHNIWYEYLTEFRQQYQTFATSYEQKYVNDAYGFIIMATDSRCCSTALTHAQPGEYITSSTTTSSNTLSLQRQKRTTAACSTTSSSPSSSNSCTWAGDHYALPWQLFMKQLAATTSTRNSNNNNNGNILPTNVYLDASLMMGTLQNMYYFFQRIEPLIDSDEDEHAILTDYLYLQHQFDNSNRNMNPNQRPFGTRIVLDYGHQLFGRVFEGAPEKIMSSSLSKTKKKNTAGCVGQGTNNYETAEEDSIDQPTSSLMQNGTYVRSPLFLYHRRDLQCGFQQQQQQQQQQQEQELELDGNEVFFPNWGDTVGTTTTSSSSSSNVRTKMRFDAITEHIDRFFIQGVSLPDLPSHHHYGRYGTEILYMIEPNQKIYVTSPIRRIPDVTRFNLHTEFIQSVYQALVSTENQEYYDGDSISSRWGILRKAVSAVGFPFWAWFGDYHGCNIKNKDNNKYSIQDEDAIPLFTTTIRMDCLYGYPIPSYHTLHDLSQTTPTAWYSTFQNNDQLYPWSKKIQRVVWRGSLLVPTSTNQASMNSATAASSLLFNSVRWRIVKTVHDYGYEKYLDVGFDEISETIIRQYNIDPAVVGGIRKTITPHDKMQQYVAVLHLGDEYDYMNDDNNSNNNAGSQQSPPFSTILCSNSLLIAVIPTDGVVVEHYYHDLEPWKHYIPIQADLSDLIDNVRYVLDSRNEHIIREIIATANQFCSERFVHTTQPQTSLSTTTPQPLVHDMLDAWEHYVTTLTEDNPDWMDQWVRKKQAIFSSPLYDVVEVGTVLRTASM